MTPVCISADATDLGSTSCGVPFVPSSWWYLRRYSYVVSFPNPWMPYTACRVSAITLRLTPTNPLDSIYSRSRCIHNDFRRPVRRNRAPVTQISLRCTRRTISVPTTTMAKRKRLSTLANEKPLTTVPIPAPCLNPIPPPPTRRPPVSRRTASQAKSKAAFTNPDEDQNVLDGTQALRASPDSDGSAGIMKLARSDTVAATRIKRNSEDVPSLVNGGDSDSSLSDLSDMSLSPKKGAGTSAATGSKPVDTAPPLSKPPGKQTRAATKETQFLDPEADVEEEADEEEIQAALARPPPVNSDYLPLPWKGRLGYVCR